MCIEAGDIPFEELWAREAERIPQHEHWHIEGGSLYRKFQGGYMVQCRGVQYGEVRSVFREYCGCCMVVYEDVAVLNAVGGGQPQTKTSIYRCRRANTGPVRNLWRQLRKYVGLKWANAGSKSVRARITHRDNKESEKQKNNIQPQLVPTLTAATSASHCREESFAVPSANHR